MLRKARIDAPGALHHELSVEALKENGYFKIMPIEIVLLVRLSAILSDTSTPGYAWVLIPNHFHLLLRTGTEPITTVMRQLLTGYAVTFGG